MKKYNKKYLIIICVILLLAVGFAVLTADLNIKGNFTFSNNNWKIKINSAAIDSFSATSQEPTLTSDTSVSFKTNLKKPGDFYTFYMDISNNGTLDAMMDGVEVTGLEEVTDYVECNVTYDNDTPITKGDILYKSYHNKIKVSLEYKDITKEQIPDRDIEINASVTINYKQAKDAQLVPETNGKIFIYSGSEVTYTVPYDGVYKLEVWGAQGRTSTTNKIRVGGYGGYSTGYVSLKAKDILYINVGRVGQFRVNVFGGGGYGDYGGGGATHIATKSGTLASLENNLDDILIVAGGGGGNDTCLEIIPSGGGFKGNNGWSAIGGSYEAPSSSTADKGKFGLGGSSPIVSDDSGGAGGGGFYGGDASTDVGRCGAGGSGYIGNTKLTNKAMYCYKCQESNQEDTRTYSIDRYSTAAIAKYAKDTNGYARISIVSIN